MGRMKDIVTRANEASRGVNGWHVPGLTREQIAQAFEQHRRASWGSSVEVAMRNPVARAELIEAARRMPAYMRAGDRKSRAAGDD